MLRLDALILAAGAGARFGGGKLLATYAGRPLVEHALNAAFVAPVRSVTLVTGADARVGPAVEAWAELNGQRLAIVHAPDHAEGMAASLRAGVAALPAGSAGAFVFLADMPNTPRATFQALAAAVLAGAPAAAPVHAGQRGHPAVLSAALYPQIATLTGDRGARTLLDGLGPALALVPTDDEGVLFDVDRPADLLS
jgi:molybdenum cofactor cytidylyltransferase